MELSFGTRELRDYWSDPAAGALSEADVALGKRVLEDLSAANSAEELRFLLDLEYSTGALQFAVNGALTFACLLDEDRVAHLPDGSPDFSTITRIQIVSINKIGGAL